MLFVVGVLWQISYSVLNVLYVSFSRLITSVREEQADFTDIDYSILCAFTAEGFQLHGAWDRLLYPSDNRTYFPSKSDFTKNYENCSTICWRSLLVFKETNFLFAITTAGVVPCRLYFTFGPLRSVGIF